MKNNSVRIVGGKWRGQRINFPPIKDIRPTPDRVKETLFNWLMHDITDADCLDAFAGSGALGVEALSRGAKHVTFIDQSAKVCQSLKAIMQKYELDFETALLHQVKVTKWLKRLATKQFDIIFLDPPFFQHLVPECLELIDMHYWLKPGGLVYAEYESELLIQGLLPEGWQCLKAKNSGDVGAALIQKPEHSI